MNYIEILQGERKYSFKGKELELIDIFKIAKSFNFKGRIEVKVYNIYNAKLIQNEFILKV